MLVTIYSFFMGVMEYALYILRKTTLCIDRAFLRIWIFLYSSYI